MTQRTEARVEEGRATLALRLESDGDFTTRDRRRMALVGEERPGRAYVCNLSLAHFNLPNPPLLFSLTLSEWSVCVPMRNVLAAMFGRESGDRRRARRRQELPVWRARVMAPAGPRSKQGSIAMMMPRMRALDGKKNRGQGASFEIIRIPAVQIQHHHQHHHQQQHRHRFHQQQRHSHGTP